MTHLLSPPKASANRPPVAIADLSAGDMASRDAFFRYRNARNLFLKTPTPETLALAVGAYRDFAALFNPGDPIATELQAGRIFEGLARHLPDPD